MIATFFNHFIILLSVAVAVLYVSRFRYNDNSYKIYSVYLVFIAIIQCTLFIYARQKMNNLFLFPYYFIGQFVLMSAFYYFLLRKKWILWAVPIVLSSLVIQYVFLPETAKDFNPFGLSITQSIIVIYALMYYYKSLVGEAKFLFVNAGVLLYFLTSILYFTSSDWIRNLDLPFLIDSIFKSINDVLYFVFLVFMFIEWYRNYRVKGAVPNAKM